MITLNVPDMSCGHCKAAISDAVTGQDASAKLDFDMEARRVTIESTLDAAALRALLEAEGYPNSPEG
ncbi:MAG: heavy-metal-associated domain-containing protein [Brevirhabdus sp.]